MSINRRYQHGWWKTQRGTMIQDLVQMVNKPSAFLLSTNFYIIHYRIYRDTVEICRRIQKASGTQSQEGINTSVFSLNQIDKNQHKSQRPPPDLNLKNRLEAAFLSILFSLCLLCLIHAKKIIILKFLIIRDLYTREKSLLL